MLSTTLALLVMAAVAQPAPCSGPLRDAQLTQADYHTLVTPNVSGANEAGRFVQLPGGGLGVTSGGTANYQTLLMPGGGTGVIVPNGGGVSTVIGSGGRVGVITTPR
jgi:hypothetical protein